MTQEEKAKAYDEALERARALNNGKDVDVEAGTTTCEYIFPELKESEDEKIKELLKHYLEVRRCQTKDNEEYIKCNHFLAWLEKQGEQPKEVTCTYEVETGNGNIKALVTEKAQIPKFKVGDWITNGDYTWKVIQVELLDYVLQSQNGDVVDDAIFYVDEQFHHWRLKDAKDGDILATSAGAFIYNGNNGGGCCPGCYCGINTLGNFKTGTKHHWTTIPVFPATKEQRDALMKVMDDAGYEFDFEKKELKMRDIFLIFN